MLWFYPSQIHILLLPQKNNYNDHISAFWHAFLVSQLESYHLRPCFLISCLKSSFFQKSVVFPWCSVVSLDSNLQYSSITYPPFILWLKKGISRDYDFILAYTQIIKKDASFSFTSFVLFLSFNPIYLLFLRRAA